jgi:hypothetical protein
MSDLDRLPELLAELRGLVREGNGVVKDLWHAIRGARDACADLPATVTSEITQEVTAGLEAYDKQLAIAIAEATQAAYDRFDTIAMICLGEDPESVREGKRSVTDLIRLYLKTKGLPWELVPVLADRAQMMAAEHPAAPDAFRKKEGPSGQ